MISGNQDIGLEDGLRCVPLGGRTEDGGEVPREGAQVHGLEVGQRSAVLEAREVEQRVDQLVEPQRVAMDERELLLLDLQLCLTEEVLERAEHEGERRAELVRDVGEEERLGPVQVRQILT